MLIDTFVINWSALMTSECSRRGMRATGPKDSIVVLRAFERNDSLNTYLMKLKKPLLSFVLI